MPGNVVDNYGWGESATPESCGYIAPEIVRLLNLNRSVRVVDIGCGNGALCGVLAKAGFKPVGVEYDAEGVAEAKKNHPQLNFYQAGVYDDPALVTGAEGQFDTAVCTEVVEHLFSPHMLPIFARALLVPQGKIIITTPYHGYWKNLALAVFGRWDSHLTALWHGGHIKFWSRKTLEQLLAVNGFKVTGFYGVGRIPYLWKSMVVVAVRV